MAILSTTVAATHTNAIQATAIFETHVIPPTPDAIIVGITLKRDTHQVAQNDFELDPQKLTHPVDIREQEISLSGELRLDLNGNVVIFRGNLVFPGQVNVGMNPVIVAVF